MRRSQIGQASAHVLHVHRAGAGLYVSVANSTAERVKRLAAEDSAGRSSERHEINQVSGRPGSRTQRPERTVDRSGLQAKRGVVPTAGQSLVAAPRRFGTRENVRSTPPSAMKNVGSFESLN